MTIIWHNNSQFFEKLKPLKIPLVSINLVYYICAKFKVLSGSIDTILTF